MHCDHSEIVELVRDEHSPTHQLKTGIAASLLKVSESATGADS